MLQLWLTFTGNALLLLLGVQLSIAAFFLLPTYVEYAQDTQHLGVDLHHILVSDRFTNVAAAFCVLYPVPVLCSFGRARSIRPFRIPDSIYGPPLPSAFSPAAAPIACRCLSDALVGQHIFFGQLGFSIPSIERTADFLASSPLSSAASQFAYDGIEPEEGSAVYVEVAAMFARVDAALAVAQRAVTRVAIDIEFAWSRLNLFNRDTSARFAHHAAFSGLRTANFIHNFLPFLDPVRTTDFTLRRVIEYLVPVTVASAETINADTAIAVDALITLRDTLAVDALDTLSRTYSSFNDHRQAISHCATISSSSSPVCFAVEMLLQNVSMVESMRDELVSLMETVNVCSKDLDSYFVCALGPQRCTPDGALQLLLSSESYIAGWGMHGRTNFVNEARENHAINKNQGFSAKLRVEMAFSARMAESRLYARRWSTGSDCTIGGYGDDPADEGPAGSVRVLSPRIGRRACDPYARRFGSADCPIGVHVGDSPGLGRDIHFAPYGRHCLSCIHLSGVGSYNFDIKLVLFDSPQAPDARAKVPMMHGGVAIAGGLKVGYIHVSLAEHRCDFDRVSCGYNPSVLRGARKQSLPYAPLMAQGPGSRSRFGVGRVRSLRYFTVVRGLQKQAGTPPVVQCPSCDCGDVLVEETVAPSSCGHMGCGEHHSSWSSSKSGVLGHEVAAASMDRDYETVCALQCRRAKPGQPSLPLPVWLGLQQKATCWARRGEVWSTLLAATVKDRTRGQGVLQDDSSSTTCAQPGSHTSIGGRHRFDSARPLQRADSRSVGSVGSVALITRFKGDHTVPKSAVQSNIFCGFIYVIALLTTAHPLGFQLCLPVFTNRLPGRVECAEKDTVNNFRICKQERQDTARFTAPESDQAPNSKNPQVARYHARVRPAIQQCSSQDPYLDWQRDEEHDIAQAPPKPKVDTVEWGRTTTTMGCTSSSARLECVHHGVIFLIYIHCILAVVLDGRRVPHLRIPVVDPRRVLLTSRRQPSCPLLGTRAPRHPVAAYIPSPAELNFRRYLSSTRSRCVSRRGARIRWDLVIGHGMWSEEMGDDVLGNDGGSARGGWHDARWPEGVREVVVVGEREVDALAVAAPEVSPSSLLDPRNGKHIEAERGIVQSRFSPSFPAPSFGVNLSRHALAPVRGDGACPMTTGYYRVRISHVDDRTVYAHVAAPTLLRTNTAVLNDIYFTQLCAISVLQRDLPWEEQRIKAEEEAVAATIPKPPSPAPATGASPPESPTQTQTQAETLPDGSVRARLPLPGGVGVSGRVHHLALLALPAGRAAQARPLRVRAAHPPGRAHPERPLLPRRAPQLCRGPATIPIGARFFVWCGNDGDANPRARRRQKEQWYTKGQHSCALNANCCIGNVWFSELR
ncbi:hypothetical protein LXA43DRAFT_1068618 [Ganoderma leucocontextum]|nr:hypothetical protein LXA43DRAFT_1068618 [Ganoderma leucocontextum]